MSNYCCIFVPSTALTLDLDSSVPNTCLLTHLFTYCLLTDPGHGGALHGCVSMATGAIDHTLTRLLPQTASQKQLHRTVKPLQVETALL